MSEASLVFPFQLFDPHPAIERGRKVFLIEDSLVFGDPHVGLGCHKQRLILYRRSLQSMLPSKPGTDTDNV